MIIFRALRSTAVATSPLGSYVATVSSDKSLRLWNDTVKAVSALALLLLLSLPAVHALCAPSQLSCERKFDLMSGGAAVSYSPAGDMVAVGLDNGIVSLIKVWRLSARSSPFHSIAPVQDNAFAKNAKIGGEQIGCLAFSPDGALLAAGCNDQSVYVLTLPGLEIKNKFKSNTSSVRCCVARASARAARPLPDA